MSDKLFESISALMDNEVDDLELRRLLKAMETNDELTRVWSRYHVARSVLHKELSVSSVTVDLTSRVRDAIEKENTHRERTFMDLLPRTAAVAAVAMVSVLLTAKLIVNQQPSDISASNNVVATATLPNVANPAIQRAGYIVGQPAQSPSLRAQRNLQYNDVQRVEQINMQHGYIVLPAADAPPSAP
jgi:sigma-E factor negative regulatory protein RseA